MSDRGHGNEPALSLHLCIACLELARSDCADAVGKLTTLFSDMNHLLATSPEPSVQPQLQQQLQQAVEGFQFHDRLNQQMALVLNTLQQISAMSSDPKTTAEDWQDLHRQMRAGTTMAAETELIDAVLNGSDLKQALEHARQQQSGTAGDIDLF